MTTFGAVPVGGRNFFRLMQNGEAVLLFPGGVREVCVCCRSCQNPQLLSQCLLGVRQECRCSCCRGLWRGCEMVKWITTSR